MEKLPVAKHLNDLEYKFLLETYAEHNSSMGFEDRKNHTLSDITKVERNISENCLNVYYNDGNWWHYTPSKTWY